MGKAKRRKRRRSSVNSGESCACRYSSGVSSRRSAGSVTGVLPRSAERRRSVTALTLGGGPSGGERPVRSRDPGFRRPVAPGGPGGAAPRAVGGTAAAVRGPLPPAGAAAGGAAAAAAAAGAPPPPRGGTGGGRVAVGPPPARRAHAVQPAGGVTGVLRRGDAVRCGGLHGPMVPRTPAPGTSGRLGCWGCALARVPPAPSGRRPA